MQSLLQIRQDRYVHVGEILLVQSPNEGGGHQGNDTLKMDNYKKKKLQKNEEKLTRKKENQKRDIKVVQQKKENKQTKKKQNKIGKKK